MTWLGELQDYFTRKIESQFSNKQVTDHDTSNSGESFAFSGLLKDPYVIIVTGSVWFSTSAMALLEPCLPLWLMSTMHPEVNGSNNLM